MYFIIFSTLALSFQHEIIYVDNATVQEVRQNNVGVIIVASGLTIYLLILIIVISIYCYPKKKGKHQIQLDENLRNDN